LNANKAVFLDRDGVINAAIVGPEGPDSPRSVAEFRLLPGVAAAIRSLNEMRMPVVVVSNQPGIAKGKFDPEALNAMTRQMVASLAIEGAHLDGIYYCTHHPEAIVEDYRVVCECRKPKPGLLRKAADELAFRTGASFIVGDQLRDMAAGKSAGCTTIMVGATQATRPAEADHVCLDLPAAAALILELEKINPPLQAWR
jgi:D-glycero-D-manno-heptose 1,7-bisphosphate phosphatase